MNSAALVMIYMAIVMRSWSAGYIPSANPPRLAPMAGAKREVREFEIRVLRRRKGAASFVRRLVRKREKKR